MHSDGAADHSDLDVEQPTCNDGETVQLELFALCRSLHPGCSYIKVSHDGSVVSKPASLRAEVKGALLA